MSTPIVCVLRAVSDHARYAIIRGGIGCPQAARWEGERKKTRVLGVTHTSPRFDLRSPISTIGSSLASRAE